MNISRESYYDKKINAPSTNKNETSSSFSSDSDQTPKCSQKKRKEKKTSKQMSTPDYFPVYTPSWATMNYVYLDLLRKLSLESEIRTSLTKIEKKYDCSCLKDLQGNKIFEEKHCFDKRKMMHKRCSCEDFKMSCSQLCLSCHQKIKCSSCGQNILQNRVPEAPVPEIKPLKHCKCAYDSCPTLLDLQHIPLSCCHYHCQTPTCTCHSIRHTVCGSLNSIPVETPVREMPEFDKSTRRVQNILDSEACNESDSNLDKLLNEKDFSIDNSIAKNTEPKNQPVLQITNKNARRHDFEDDHRLVPSFLGGTGDEGSKVKVKRTRKSRIPQSTAYFLPISSLNTK